MRKFLMSVAVLVIILSCGEAYASNYAVEILRLVNAERSRYGLTPLRLADDLQSAAAIRAREIVVKFAHTRPDGTDCFTVLSTRGQVCAENIAAGYSSAEETVVQWLNSEGHRNNILNPDFDELGVGCFYDANSYYKYHWVQLFRGGGRAPDAREAANFANEVLKLVNAERSRYGLTPLRLADDLQRSAAIRAREIVVKFAHVRPDGSSCFTAMDTRNKLCGENVAGGCATPASVVKTWMNSAGHRENILNRDFRELGVGYSFAAGSEYTHYWVQLFRG